MAFKNVRNLLLINHNDGFINDDEFVVLYDLYASKTLTFCTIPTHLLTWKSFTSLRVSKVSLLKTRYTNSEGSFANP